MTGDNRIPFDYSIKEEEEDFAFTPLHILPNQTFSDTTTTSTSNQPKAQLPTISLETIEEEKRKATLLLDSITKMCEEQDSELEQLRIQQLRFITQLNIQTSQTGTLIISQDILSKAAQFRDRLWHIHHIVEMEINELQLMHKMIILEPSALNLTRSFIQRLKLQQSNSQIARSELQIVLNPQAAPPCVASLLITEQPIPQVVFKNKSLEDNFHLALFTGSSVSVINAQQVTASLDVADEASWKTKTPIENYTQPMDINKLNCQFENIKFNVSTRMSMVYLRFSVQIQLMDQTHHLIESNGSSPLIVITNESQWCDAAGKLLVFEAFGLQEETSWSHLANVTHTHFLKATRQELSNPARRLYPQEFQYLHYKFFMGQPTVNQQQAVKYWSWFGQVVQSLRFKRHISHLWFAGLIYGFLTKNMCNQLLKDEDVGTFIIRFSESYPGLFAVAYVDLDPYERVKHYLVKHEDISSNKTLPDFLREKSQFMFIKQLDPVTGKMTRLVKDQAFKEYYSKRQRPEPQNGYVSL
eukprot:TRINITY_DN3264_c0_g1_i1.p1 TRINITY_DN3264_c0_g1~~TRINITY_DN3264_c0_g1_i1.p1  ORF type:complete len:561 (-),score=75.93 TRINITY_DN3264_c0_g1_i1:110-1690(-)